MAKDVDESLKDIFHSYRQIRVAGIKQDNDLLKHSLADGLSQSCLFLQDVSKWFKDKTQNSIINYYGNTIEDLRKDTFKLKEFLDAERGLLKLTKLPLILTDNLLDFIEPI